MTLKPAAEKAIADERARLKELRNFGLMSPAHYASRLATFIRETLREAFTEAGDVSYIGTRCPQCQDVHIMPSDVQFYRCRCSEHVERPSFRYRIPLV